MSRLFKQYTGRGDEEGRPLRYSELLGSHPMAFDSEAWKAYVTDVKSCTDKMLDVQKKLKTRIDARKLSKDKTNLLHFAFTVDQLEKVSRFLLPSQLTEPRINALTPVDRPVL